MTHTNPSSNSASDDIAIAAIAEALNRLRGRGRNLAHKVHHDKNSDSHRQPEPQDERFRHRSPGHHARGGAHGGSPAIARTLEALEKTETPLGVSEIAEQIGVDQPRASRLVQQGVARGLFAREADPDDARRSRVALTDRGREFATNLRTRQHESLGVALESFSDTERNDLARLLTRLADNWPV